MWRNERRNATNEQHNRSWDRRSRLNSLHEFGAILIMVANDRPCRMGAIPVPPILNEFDPLPSEMLTDLVPGKTLVHFRLASHVPYDTAKVHPKQFESGLLCQNWTKGCEINPSFPFFWGRRTLLSIYKGEASTIIRVAQKHSNIYRSNRYSE